MALKGDLSTVGLAEVFQMISMSQKQGTLVVQDGESRKAIYFGKEGVSLLSTGKRKGFRIGDILVRAGKISDAQLQDILARKQETKRKLGEELVASGMVTEDEIQQVVRSQIEEEIYDLFLWKRAAFEFIEGDPVEELKDPNVISLSFDLNGLLLEAVRRTDEWTRINQKIPSLDYIYKTVGEDILNELSRNGDERVKSVVRHLDGQQTVNDIVEQSLLPRFDICNTLVELMDRGKIRQLDVPEIIQVARQRLEEGKREKGLALFHVAVLHAPEDAELLDGYAHALETEGLIPEAARTYLRVGNLLKARGQTRESVGYFQRALSLLPNDPQSKEALFEINLAQGNIEEAIQTVREIVSTALKTHEYQMARGVCEKAMQAAPQSLEVRLGLARIYHALGLKEDRDEQVHFIQKNLPVDQAAADRIQIELREISEQAAPPKVKLTSAGPRSPRRPLRAPRVGVIAAALVVGLLGAGIFYEYKADQGYGDLAARVKALEEQGKLKEARDLLASFGESPWRHSVLLAGRIRGELSSLDLRIANLPPGYDPLGTTPTPDPVDLEARRKEMERRRKLKEMDDLETAMDVAYQHGEMEKAQRLAQDLSMLAGDMKDDSRRRKAADLEARITEYLKGAYTLKSEMIQAEKDGRFARAAEKAEELLKRFPLAEASKGVTFPLCLRVSPAGVQVLRDDQPLTVTNGEDYVLRLREADKGFRLKFARNGYRSKEVDVPNHRVGLVQVMLDEREPDWKFPVGSELLAAPILKSGLLVVRTREKVFGLTSDNRILKWDEKMDPAVGADIKVAGDRLILAAGRHLVVIDLNRNPTGMVAARIDLESQAVGNPGLSADGSVAWVGTSDLNLVAVNLATGEILWKRKFPREIRAEPVEVGGMLLVAETDGKISAIKGKDDAPAWTLSAQGEISAAPAVSGGTVYVGSGSGKVMAVNAATGDPVWASQPLGGEIVCTPAVAGDVILAATTVGQVHALDAAKGELKWTCTTAGEIRATPIVAGSIALVGSADTWMYAVDISGGRVRWRCPTSKRIRVAAVVGEGRVYFGSDDQVLYSVTLE